MNLLALHTQPLDPAQAHACTCLRAACGAAESGPGIAPSGCGDHGKITVRHHLAVDCPALPADTDLSRLWIVRIAWTGRGPHAEQVTPYSRAELAALRGTGALWELATGDAPADAERQWQDRVDTMRASAARQQAAQVAAVQEAARVRQAGLAALRNSGTRAARRVLATPTRP